MMPETDQRDAAGPGNVTTPRATRRVRALALITAVATYLLVVLGSTVRVSDSGMGCSSWPLCNGRIGPIDHLHPLLEQSHRYLATIVTVAIVALVVLTWRGGARVAQVRTLSLLCLGIVVVQIVLGAITVLTDNAPVTVAAHLIVGLLFLAAVTVTAVASFVDPARPWGRFSGDGIAWAGVAGLFVVLLSGSVVVDGGAEAACRSWPACFASPSPTRLVSLQYVHRSLVLVAAVLVVAYVVALWRDHRATAIVAASLLAAQVVVGAFDAVLGAPAALADVHLALASALWAVVTGSLARSALTPRSTDPPGARAAAHDPESARRSIALCGRAHGVDEVLHGAVRDPGEHDHA